MKGIFKSVLLSAACAAFPMIGLAQDVTLPVSGDFADLKLQWNGGEITSYEGKWAVMVNQDGFIMICGVGKMKDSRSVQATLQWLHSIKITYEDQNILQDVTYFTRMKSNADLNKATATCKATKAKAPNGPFSVGMTSAPVQAQF